MSPSSLVRTAWAVLPKPSEPHAFDDLLDQIRSGPRLLQQLKFACWVTARSVPAEIRLATVCTKTLVGPIIGRGNVDDLYAAPAQGLNYLLHFAPRIAWSFSASVTSSSEKPLLHRCPGLVGLDPCSTSGPLRRQLGRFGMESRPQGRSQLGRALPRSRIRSRYCVSDYPGQFVMTGRPAAM